MIVELSPIDRISRLQALSNIKHAPYQLVRFVVSPLLRLFFVHAIELSSVIRKPSNMS